MATKDSAYAAARAVFLTAAVALAGNVVAAGDAADRSKDASDLVTISGAVEHTLKLGVADLRAFMPQQVMEIPVASHTNTGTAKFASVRGVLLRDLLERAAVISNSHNDVKKMAIIAEATDGYKVVFSWNEVFNTSVGEGVIVFFERDGKPLDEGEGQIAMVSAKDIRTGPRHVKWLKAIEVRKVVD